ncbi:MAG: hypothetical protein Roseis2KO_02280 [Roseivirga sp.]
MIDTATYNVLLCGTQYGRVYLPAIFEARELELAAILARGSSRSVRIAEQSGVACYLSVADLDIPVDLACVAIGGTTGMQTALDLLKRKVPVLIEHPIGHEDCHLLLDTATANETVCHINGHFADLPPAKDFTKISRILNREHAPLVISGAANTRTLYSMLDLMMRSFGVFSIRELSVQPLGTDQNYISYNFNLKGTPVQLILQNWKGEKDDSRDAPLGHQLSVTYPTGTLHLTGTYGPCLWNPLVASIPNRTVPIALSGHATAQATIAHISDWRIKANQEAMSELTQCAGAPGMIIEHQQPEYLKALTTAWSTLIAEAKPVIRPDIPELIDQTYWTTQSILSAEY